MSAAQLLQILNPEERARLLELEEQVMVGASAALLAGRALTEIRDTRLYRGEFASFEEYVSERFGFSRQRAYQLIDYAATAGEFERRGLLLPPERLTRALGGVLPDDYQLVLDVTRGVTGKAHPSSADVQATAEVVRDLASGAHVEHPDTGEPVPLAQVPPGRRVEAVSQAVQRGAADRRTYQGADDVRPLDWLSGFQQMGMSGSLEFGAAGFWVELADSETGELRQGPVRKGVWDALRAAREMWEGERGTG
ncbi:hypothetical protein SAMN04488058_101322 [Deinococcus reticulitermitis]|uniref:Uncharacterized protein n=1 Tax=Deinococcus reticulitermitis TaxID=856736 RepID=A0A1H6SJ97_9DEIO|nr:hypothetical protein [Deinococcus reticulitermitis]SEI67933.1 hypothetical protein SAMN04488058_101322 [Deinococcus reticulitermitis]